MVHASIDFALENNERLIQQRWEWQTLEQNRLRQKQLFRRLRYEQLTGWLTLFLAALSGTIIGAVLF